MSPVWPQRTRVYDYVDPNAPLTREQRRRLPTARLIGFRYSRCWYGRFILRTRGANFSAVWLGPLQICWRMPWIPRVARQLHPHIFEARNDTRS